VFGGVPPDRAIVARGLRVCQEPARIALHASAGGAGRGRAGSILSLVDRGGLEPPTS
jgi:hypothetical protein